MNSRLLIISLLLLTLLGGILRFVGLTTNPPSLNIDEVAIGYDAYSILKTGKDQHGEKLPLSFKSTGDYKNPIVVYLLVPSIAIFGLNEFGIRFPTALLATLSIPLYFLLFRKITNSTKVAFIGAVLLTISPWHIYFSRYVFEHLLATFFVSMGVLTFLKMLKEGSLWPILSGLLFALSAYTYHAERLFTPLLIVTLIIIYRREILQRKNEILVFIITVVVLALPIILHTLFGPDSTRAGMIFFSKDIEFRRNIAMTEGIVPTGLFKIFSNNFFLLIAFWFNRFLNYFSPNFLFFTGLSMTTPGSLGLGVMYLFELPFIFFGILSLFSKKTPNKWLIISWLLLGLLPTSLTNNDQSSVRSLVILPPLIIVSAMGSISLFNSIMKMKNKTIRVAIALFMGITVVWCLLRAYLVFSVYFPRQRGEAFMEGEKEVVLYALANQDKYKEIVFDPYRGVEGPYIVSIPHMYLLFYAKYDPAKYQTEEKISKDEYYHFDKFTFKQTDWHLHSADRDAEDTLFIGSPWSLPEKDLAQHEILKKVYLSNGDLVFLVVSKK